MVSDLTITYCKFYTVNKEYVKSLNFSHVQGTNNNTSKCYRFSTASTIK